MKKFLAWFWENFQYLILTGFALMVIFAVIEIADKAGKSAQAAKALEKQIAVESVRRGYAELVVNTNTGDFEVQLKEVAP